MSSLGGTKCVCILGTGPDDVRAVERLPTGEREETLRQIEAVLERWRSQYGNVRALGHRLVRAGRSHARIAHLRIHHLHAPSPAGATPTSRSDWAALGVPVGFDTDVNGAALAEGRWGAAQGLDDYAYVTVGTGIGVGSIVRGRPIFGMNHTELGHIRVVRKAGDTFAGRLFVPRRLHRRTGLGPGHRSTRVGSRPRNFRPIIPAWEFVAHGLGQLMHTMVLTTAPARIFLGGGVMSARRICSNASAGTEAQPQSLRRGTGARTQSRPVHRAAGPGHDVRTAGRAGTRGGCRNQAPRSRHRSSAAASR